MLERLIVNTFDDTQAWQLISPKGLYISALIKEKSLNVYWPRGYTFRLFVLPYWVVYNQSKAFSFIGSGCALWQVSENVTELVGNTVRLRSTNCKPMVVCVKYLICILVHFDANADRAIMAVPNLVLSILHPRNWRETFWGLVKMNFRLLSHLVLLFLSLLVGFQGVKHSLLITFLP